MSDAQSSKKLVGKLYKSAELQLDLKALWSTALPCILCHRPNPRARFSPFFYHFSPFSVPFPPFPFIFPILPWVPVIRETFEVGDIGGL